MTPVADERALAAIAAQIIGDRRGLTPPERAVAPRAAKLAAEDVESIRREIHAGLDPLGDDFIRLRSAETRRARGAIYTPAAIVEAMIATALAEPGERPARIIDPGAGSGRYLIAAARAFPDAALFAVEIDPLATLILRVNAEASGFADRLTIHVGDYRTFGLPPIAGRTLFIGNPPYVRHHQIDEGAKVWYAASMARLGAPKASKLAGLHIHFFARTAEIARLGDFAVYVTSAEWLATRYGSALRTVLCGALGGRELTIIDAKSEPFPGVMTTAVVTSFAPHSPATNLKFSRVPDAGRIARPSMTHIVSAQAAGRALSWPPPVGAPHIARPAGTRLGDVFRVSRGQVTGCNAVWIAGEEARRLVPPRFLVPCVTAADEIFAACERPGLVIDATVLTHVVDLPADLTDSLRPDEAGRIQTFLSWATAMGARASYIARHRSPWWRVRLPAPAPIVSTYMARRPPAFARNPGGASLLNIAHGLYPRAPLSPLDLDEIADSLNRSVRLQHGRTYAGGLTKFEPGNVENLVIDWRPAAEPPRTAAE